MNPKREYLYRKLELERMNLCSMVITFGINHEETLKQSHYVDKIINQINAVKIQTGEIKLDKNCSLYKTASSK